MKVTSKDLKIMAILLMLIDHIGYGLVRYCNYNTYPFVPSLYRGLRLIGRLSFPLFCFMLAEGFVYTSNRIKYLTRLVICFFISEIPYDLMCMREINYIKKTNVFMTLALGFICMWIIDYVLEKIKNPIIGLIVAAIMCIPAAALQHYIVVGDYGVVGMLAIVAIYLINRFFVADAIYYPLPTDNVKHVVAITVAVIILAIPNNSELMALADILPIALYNGKLGKMTKAMKYFAYIFYPLHITIIVLLRVAVWGV